MADETQYNAPRQSMLTGSNIVSLTNSQAQIIYDQKGLDYVSNLPFVNKRDSGGNVVINGTVLPLTDEEQAKYNESIIVELNDRVYTNSSVNRALDTQFKYFKFPAKLTTRVVPTGSIDLPDLPVEDGLLFTGRILQVENKLYYLEGSTYYEILADSPRLGFPQKHLPTLTFLLEKLEKSPLFKVLDPDPELFPEYNPFNRNGYAAENNLTFNNQRGELVRRDKIDDIIDLKSETYLNDPKFEDGGILSLADLTDNNITETVVEFNFDLIDEINPAPWEFGFLVDDIGTAFLNQSALVVGLRLSNGERRFPLNNQRTGLNRIGVHAVNLAGPGGVVYDFINKDGERFRHANGWRAQDAYGGQYGDASGFKPWGSTPTNEQMSPSRPVGEFPNDNARGTFWLGNNQFGQGFTRINAEYKWDNRGVRSAAVYRLSGIQRDIGWTPKSNTNSRYGIVKIGNILQVAVETDNFELPNGNITNIIVTLNYKSRPSKTIENAQRSTSWNGKNQISIEIPAEDVTDDLYKVDISQNQAPGSTGGDRGTTPDRVPIFIKIADRGNSGEVRITALDQPGRPTVTIPGSTRSRFNPTSPINYTQASGLQFDRINNQTIRFRIEEVRNEFDGIDSRFTNTAATGSVVRTQGVRPGSRTLEQDISWDLTGTSALIEIQMTD